MRKKKTHLPVAKITGREVGIYRDNRALWIKDCEKWYKKNLTGKKVNNPILGTISFYNSSFDETQHISRKNILELRYLPAVKIILEKSIDIVPELPNHERKKDITISMFYAVYGYVKIDGEVRKIKVLVAENENGKKYYCLDARQN